jgi:hypothetical protein
LNLAFGLGLLNLLEQILQCQLNATLIFANGICRRKARKSVAFSLLHWYNVNLRTTFSVAVGPLGMIFDGANIWVASESGNVTKLRGSDGADLGRFGVGGRNVSGVAFEGANIWVANNGNPASKP